MKTLKSSRDFHRVRSSGRRARSDGITVWQAWAPSGGPARLGVSARSRSAVQRNRIRRRMRAAWREVESGPGVEVVVGADSASLELRFQDLVEHLRVALARAGGSG